MAATAITPRSQLSGSRGCSRAPTTAPTSPPSPRATPSAQIGAAARPNPAALASGERRHADERRHQRGQQSGAGHARDRQVLGAHEPRDDQRRTSDAVDPTDDAGHRPDRDEPPGRRQAGRGDHRRRTHQADEETEPEPEQQEAGEPPEPLRVGEPRGAQQRPDDDPWDRAGAQLRRPAARRGCAAGSRSRRRREPTAGCRRGWSPTRRGSGRGTPGSARAGARRHPTRRPACRRRRRRSRPGRVLPGPRRRRRSCAAQ